MGINMKFSDLYRAPELNPINRKARSVPFLNPLNMYGRVFFFSWFGFMVAFWAWYAFPPLLSVTIKADLKLKPTQVANSNIVSLCATLVIRVIVGPLCDQFGPRKVFGALLLLGSIPVGLSPLIQNASGLYTIRFFTGILGGTFVPCLVWSTGFFDKNVVGTANALAGGFGNAGGGITYFIMPAVFDSLVHRRGYSTDKAWRLTFIIPLVMVICTGVCLLLLCPDTPDGHWRDRHTHAQQHLQEHDASNPNVVDVPGGIMEKSSTNPTTLTTTAETADTAASEEKAKAGGATTPIKVAGDHEAGDFVDHEAHLSKSEMLATAQGEIIKLPTATEAIQVAFSLQTWALILTYMCSFGSELAVNAILGSYYLKNFPTLGQTGSSNWAAMFGFLNFVTRPLGGMVADVLYNMNGGGNVWLKKIWIAVCGVMSGICLVIVGRVNPHDQSTMFGLVALAAIFIEAGNGANFALVPHVHPFANGIVSGLTGAGGNLGGVIFAVIFRFMGGGTDYAKAFWVIGVIHIAVNLAVCWVPPIPKGQIGGH